LLYFQVFIYEKGGFEAQKRMSRYGIKNLEFYVSSINAKLPSDKIHPSKCWPKNCFPKICQATEMKGFYVTTFLGAL
jgi:hypothetical protein